jgi:hypothetical protein
LGIDKGGGNRRDLPGFNEHSAQIQPKSGTPKRTKGIDIVGVSRPRTVTAGGVLPPGLGGRGMNANLSNLEPGFAWKDQGVPWWGHPAVPSPFADVSPKQSIIQHWKRQQPMGAGGSQFQVGIGRCPACRRSRPDSFRSTWHVGRRRRNSPSFGRFCRERPDDPWRARESRCYR